MENFERKEITQEEAQRAYEEGYAVTSSRVPRLIYIGLHPDDEIDSDIKFYYATNYDTFLYRAGRNAFGEPFKYYEGHGDFQLPGKEIYISRNTFNRILDICGIYTTEILPKYIDYVVKIKSRKSLNSTKDHYIKNAISGKFWLHNRDQELKLGKILQNILVDPDSTKIEKYVSKWKSAYDIDTSRVKVSSDIGMVYDISNVGGSCMANNGSFMRIYEDLDCKIAYIEEDGKLQARALLWDDNLERYGETDNTIYKFIDRIFFEKENYKLTLQKWAKENGYESLPDTMISLVTKKSVDSYEFVPYIDNMCYVIRANNGYRLTNCSDDCIDTLQQTDGSSEDNCGISECIGGIWCVDIDDYVDEDEAIYCESDEEYYYYTESLCYIDGYGWYRQDDEDICFAEDLEEYSFKDGCYYVSNSDCWYFHNDELYFVEDLDEYYDDDTDLYYTVDSGEHYYHRENVYYIEDLGKYYSNSDDLYYDEKSDTYWSTEEAFKEQLEDN